MIYSTYIIYTIYMIYMVYMMYMMYMIYTRKNDIVLLKFSLHKFCILKFSLFRFCFFSNVVFSIFFFSGSLFEGSSSHVFCFHPLASQVFTSQFFVALNAMHDLHGIHGIHVSMIYMTKPFAFSILLLQVLFSVFKIFQLLLSL